MGCQKDIAHAVRDTGADYLLQVKGNQPILEADINASIDAALEGCDLSTAPETAYFPPSSVKTACDPWAS